MHEDSPDRLVAAKSATPIVIGLGDGENFVASDIPAMLDHTRRVLFLEDGEIAEVTRERRRRSRRSTATPVTREPRTVTWDPVTAQKGGYRHFLLKEIHEQPQAIIDTMRGRILQEQGDVSLDELADAAWLVERAARSRSSRAARRGTPASSASTSSSRSRASRPRSTTAASSATATRSLDRRHGADRDLAVGRDRRHPGRDRGGARARRQGPRDLQRRRLEHRAQGRRGDLYARRSGDRRSPARRRSRRSSRCSTCSGIYLARRRGVVIGRAGARRSSHDLVNLPSHVEECLKRERAIEKVAKKYGDARDFLYLGRGINFPIALEGALKLKEISYIHAEGYAAGEMKHGPIALINEEVPVVVLLPKDAVYGKSLSNMKEVESRGGRIIVVTDTPVARPRGHRVGGHPGADEQPVPAAACCSPSRCSCSRTTSRSIAGPTSTSRAISRRASPSSDIRVTSRGGGRLSEALKEVRVISTERCPVVRLPAPRQRQGSDAPRRGSRRRAADLGN